MTPSTSAPMRPEGTSSGAPCGIPMSTTWTAPAWRLPGLIHNPSLARWKVAVALARTASPTTSPDDASTPLGTSALTTGCACALSAVIASATTPRGSPLKPVPRTASTWPACPSSAPAANGVGASPGRRSRLARASGLDARRSPVASTDTARPSSRSMRAATRPSPPLLPFPQTTAIGPSGMTVSARRARPAPARSMRSSDGTPRSSIAQRSTARIASASGSGAHQSGSSVAGGIVPRCYPGGRRARAR